MRRLALVICLTAATGFDAATALAAAPPNTSQAQAIATSYWGAQACSGFVEVSSGPLDGDVSARAEWSNPTALYGNSAQNTNCTVTFNNAQSFDWPMLCTIMVHEYGHLTGHEHTSGGVMAATYGGPISQCKGSAPSGEAQPPASSPTPQSAPEQAPTPQPAPEQAPDARPAPSEQAPAPAPAPSDPAPAPSDPAPAPSDPAPAPSDPAPAPSDMAPAPSDQAPGDASPSILPLLLGWGQATSPGTFPAG